MTPQRKEEIKQLIDKITYTPTKSVAVEMMTYIEQLEKKSYTFQNMVFNILTEPQLDAVFPNSKTLRFYRIFNAGTKTT